MRLTRYVVPAALILAFGMAPAAAAPPKTSVAAPRIVYFSWSVSGHGGETTSQEDIFTTDLNGKISRLTNDTKNSVFVSDRDPAWSVDRKTIAIFRASSADLTNRLYLIDALNGRTLKRLVPGQSPEWVDGVRLVYLDFDYAADPVTGDLNATGMDVWMVEKDTLQTVRITSLGEGVWLSGMSWNATGGLALGYATYDADWNLTGQGVVTIPAALVNGAWSGGPVATMADVTYVTEPAGVPNAMSPDWAPAGDRIAFSTMGQFVDPLSYSADVGVVDVSTLDVTWVMQEAPGDWGVVLDDTEPAFSPDGKQLAWGRGLEDEWREVWVYTFATGTSRQVTNETQGRFKGAFDW